MITAEDMQILISQGLQDSEVIVEGDDGHHFEATIICSQFESKSLIQRHQLVYEVLGDKMKSEIHALSMKTIAPSEVS